MRRRHFLAAAAAAALAGCSSRPTSPAGSWAGSSASSAAAGRPATPQEILQASTVPVLCYHQVREQTAADSAGARPLICPPTVLEGHLRALIDAGMQPVTSTQLVDHLEFGAPLPARAVVVSFDDASAGQFTAALPILQRMQIPATFFVMTVVLDRPNWLSRDDVRALDAAGMTIASHTWDHHPVTTYGRKDWVVQLDKPRAQLEQIVGHDVDLFAYPYGLWNPTALPHVQAAGYRAAFQLTGRPPDPKWPLLTIRRVLVPSSWNNHTLLTRLTTS
jgi:peptidoglycan/xylan/chitin deacetylase (PgdA/CDA1 family)